MAWAWSYPLTLDEMYRGGTTTYGAGQYDLAAWDNGWVGYTTMVGDLTSGFKVELTADETGRAVSAADALAALKIAVGLNPNSNGFDTSVYQYVAADVNQDGKVTAADALSILKMSVGLESAPQREWVFINDQTDLYDESSGQFSIERSNVDWGQLRSGVASRNGSDKLVGILKGEVNGSWESHSELEKLDQSYFEELHRLGIGAKEQWWLL